MKNVRVLTQLNRLAFFSILIFLGGTNRLVAQGNHKFVAWEKLDAPTMKQIVVLDNLLFGRSDSAIYRSANLGNTWNILKIGFASEIISTLDVDGEIFYVMTRRAIYKSGDQGASFEQVFGNISLLDGFQDVDFENGVGWFIVSNWSSSYGGPNKILPGQNRIRANGDLPEDYRGVLKSIVIDKLSPDSVAYTYGVRCDTLPGVPGTRYFKTTTCGANWVEYGAKIGRVLFSAIIDDTSFVFTRNQYSKDNGETWRDLAFCAKTFFKRNQEEKLLIAGEHSGVHFGTIDAFRPLGLSNKLIHSIAMIDKNIFAVSKDGELYHTNVPEFGDNNILGDQAENWSKTTSCAEEDNINVPLFTNNNFPFSITATHPKYEIVRYTCAADFSGCNCWVLPSNSLANLETCTELYNDGTYIVELCQETNWWLGADMEVHVNGKIERGHQVVISKKIAQQDTSLPRFFVLYQDGNLRLIPQPPVGVKSVCFGSSVIIGPAEVESKRPFAAIERIVVNIAETCLDISYQSGGSAKVQFMVDSSKARVEVTPSYDPAKPFATFRSMFVSDSVNDVSHITVADTSLPILGDWLVLNSHEWSFERKKTSSHNTSSPDIRIELGTKVGVESVASHLPNLFLLHQNSPNPFNPSTKISFTLENNGHVLLKIYNILGEEVLVLVDELMDSGKKTIEWNGKDLRGADAPSGVYIYLLETEGLKKSRKMVLIR